MILTTTETVSGREITENLGLVRGNTVRARNAGRDFTQGLRNLVGGEMTAYTELLSESREEALARMREDAERLGADAVVNVRFTNGEIMDGAVELLAYGTAVKLE